LPNATTLSPTLKDDEFAISNGTNLDNASLCLSKLINFTTATSV